MTTPSRQSLPPPGGPRTGRPLARPTASTVADPPSTARRHVVVLVGAGGHLSPSTRRALLAALASTDGAVTVALRLTDNARAAQALDEADAVGPTDAGH